MGKLKPNSLQWPTGSSQILLLPPFPSKPNRPSPAIRHFRHTCSLLVLYMHPTCTLLRAFIALCAWNTFNPVSHVAHFLISLFCWLLSLNGVEHSRQSVLTERMSLTIFSVLYHTTVLNSTRENHTDKQTCKNTDSWSPTGRPGQAPNLPSHLSLAQLLSHFLRCHLLYLWLLQKKKKKKDFFVWGISIKPPLIQLSYMYTCLSSSFSRMNPSSYW